MARSLLKMECVAPIVQLQGHSKQLGSIMIYARKFLGVQFLRLLHNIKDYEIDKQ